ncbi:MAG: VIT1/CCC1 transporter family protein, partial [Myxococcales bacterium]|nr:VIT1/CCC1 transporter family protein [Myxococcales bacterium]
MGTSPDDRWRAEKEAAWLYERVAAAEPDSTRRATFLELGRAAEEQAEILAGDLGGAPPGFAPSRRARLVASIVRRLGPHRARPLLAAIKVRGLSMYDGPVAGHAMPTSVEGIGVRHRRGSGGTLRAAVFGVNDGLVSNTSLILGIAGAGTAPSGVLLAGVAGLLAGAFSMAAGEYISMKSQRELFEYQIAQERDELERYPEEEAEELALIYAARGVPLDQARTITLAMVSDHDKALDTLAREELGLNPDDLGSPWRAAASSFAAFAGGAIVPLAPFALGAGTRALPIAI